MEKYGVYKLGEPFWVPAHQTLSDKAHICSWPSRSPAHTGLVHNLIMSWPINLGITRPDRAAK